MPVCIQATLLHWNSGDSSLQWDRPCSGHSTSMCSSAIGLEHGVLHGWSCNCDRCLREAPCSPRRSKELVPFPSDWQYSELSRWVSISVSTRLMCGVPQSSTIGPSQFRGYTEDINDIIPMFHHLYADDTQMLAMATLQSLGACWPAYRPFNVGVQHGVFSWTPTRRSSSVSRQSSNCYVFRRLE